MARATVLLLSLTFLAQFTAVQCPNAGDGGDPGGIFVPPPRVLPTEATASTETADTFGQNVELRASATDIGGGAITYSWVQIGGPGVSINNPFNATASFDAPSLADDSTLTFMVATRDAAGDAGRATVEVVVLRDPNFGFNPGPVGNGNGGGGVRLNADAGPDQEVESEAEVTLDGGASSGQGLSYNWTQVGGPEVELRSPTAVQSKFVAPAFAEGALNRLEFELTVRDNSGGTDADRVIVRVLADDGVEPGVKPRVRLVTTFGNIVVELNPEAAPITVANFLEYVDAGYYSGLIFHRVIPGFVVQGGGFEPGLVPRDTRDPIALEADNGLRNDRGTIAMARTNDPDSATSQFYFNLVNNTSLNADTSPPGYTVFGRVVEGLSVVDRIATVATESVDNFMDVPVDDIIIQRVERVVGN